jgi:predicted HTH domain antitoxin
MSFNLQVKVDATQANPAIESVGANLDKVKGKAKETQASMGSLFTAIGGTAALIAAGHQLEDVLRQAEQLSDRYTELENRAQKFAVAGIQVTTVLAQQAAVAHELHTTLEPLQALYSGVRAATVDVSLSTKEFTGIVTTLGEAAKLAGQPVDSASQIFDRLRLALESGTGAGKAMKTIIIDFPALAHQWAAAMHTDEEGLVKLATTGKLSFDQLALATASTTGAVNDAFGKRKETYEEERQEIIQNIAIYRQSMDSMQAVAEAANPEVHKFNEEMRDVRDPSRVAQRELAQTTAAVQDLISSAVRAREHMLAMAGAEMAQELLQRIDQINQLGVAISRAFGNDPWGGSHDKTGLLAFLPTGTEEAMKYAASIGEAKRQLGELNAAHAAGAIKGEAYQKQLEGLLTTLNSGQLPSSIKIWHELHDGVDVFHRDLAALETMWKNGAVGEQEYERALSAIVAENPALKQHGEQVKAATDEWVKLTNAAREAAAVGITLPSSVGLTGPHFAGAEREAQSDVIGAKRFDAYAASEQNEQEKARLELLGQYEDAADKYAAALLKIKDAEDDGYVTDQEASRFRIEALKEYNQALLEQQKAYTSWEQHATDAVSGVDRALKGFGETVHDVGKDLEKTLTSAFDNINKSLTDLITTGTTDFRGLATGIGRDFVTFGLHRAEAGIFDAFGGKGGSALGGSASIGAMGTAAAGAATALGALTAAATAAAGAMGGAGLASIIPQGAAAIGGLNATGGLAESPSVVARKAVDARMALAKTLNNIRPR